jgi:hypothetical protein
MDQTGWRLDGNIFVRNSERYLPLYEAKMLHHFDHRFGTYEGQTQAQANQNKLPELTPEQHADPCLVTLPEYWVPEHEVADRLAGRWDRGWLLGWRDITNPTNERTVIVSALPRAGVGHTYPLFLSDSADLSQMACLYANLSALVLDYAARQKIGGTHLTYGYLNQLPVLPPAKYRHGCPWAERGQVRDWLLPRVLELTYTAWDLEPFAKDLGYTGPPFRWDESRRFLLRCELDAAFFHLYGIGREEAMNAATVDLPAAGLSAPAPSAGVRGVSLGATSPPGVAEGSPRTAVPAPRAPRHEARPRGRTCSCVGCR